MNTKLNSIDDLRRFKKNLDEVIARHENDMLLSEELKTLDSFSFASLRSLFGQISESIYNSGDKKLQKNFASYCNTIKENMSLRNLLRLDEMICKSNAPINAPTIFINESVTLGKYFINDDYLVGKKKLANIIRESIKGLGLSYEEVCKMKDCKNLLSENLEYLLVTPKSIKTVADYSDKLSSLIESVEKREPKEDVSTKSPSEFIAELNDTLDESLTSSEREAIIETALLTLNNGSKEDLFETYKNRCLDRISFLLEQNHGATNFDIKSTLTTFKTNLNEKKYNDESFNEDIVTLAQLYETLLED